MHPTAQSPQHADQFSPVSVGTELTASPAAPAEAQFVERSLFANEMSSGGNSMLIAGGGLLLAVIVTGGLLMGTFLGGARRVAEAPQKTFTHPTIVVVAPAHPS